MPIQEGNVVVVAEPPAVGISPLLGCHGHLLRRMGLLFHV